jgi:hypothetical protein
MVATIAYSTDWDTGTSHISRGSSMHWILNHIGCFVSESRGNESVEELTLFPYTFYDQDDDVWDKVGQAIGNLQSLKTLHISHLDYQGDNPDEDQDENGVAVLPG